MQPLLPKIYLIRHGETEWSLSGKHTGRADIHLTANGELEAKRLAKQIEGVSFRYILVSPLERAQQTCRSAGLSENSIVEFDLIEWDNGEYEGRTHKEIETTRPGWSVFRDGCPSGESTQQISDRADRLIAKLQMLSGNIALFTHGHFGRVLGVRWIRLPVEMAERLLLDTASLSILSYQHGQFTQPAIALWNSTIHRTTPHQSKREGIERWENEGGELHRTRTAPRPLTH